MIIVMPLLYTHLRPVRGATAPRTGRRRAPYGVRTLPVEASCVHAGRSYAFNNDDFAEGILDFVDYILCFYET
jgi:hypothetical protein